jgi:Leucine-rich repeat (LRR) protein
MPRVSSSIRGGRGGRGPPPVQHYNYPSFNVEEYLNSLPDNIIEIDLSNKGITSIPDLSRFINLQQLDCSYNKLITLPKLNSTLQQLDCSHNDLSSLPELNINLLHLDCSDNNLTSLPELNENLYQLVCSDNNLTSLPRLNKNLLRLNCSNNYLTSLPELNENLWELVCSYNNITSLPDLKKLNSLFCSYTEITRLPMLNLELELLYCIGSNLSELPILNENLKRFDFSETPICDIIFNITINDENETYYGEDGTENGTLVYSLSINITKEKIKRINKFRFLYYSLKFKQKFRDWLWKKVREPQILQHYHPSKLLELLKDKNINDISEEKLNNW